MFAVVCGRTTSLPEDAADANAVATALGFSFGDRRIAGSWAPVTGSHALVSGLSGLALASGNGLPVRTASGQVLARAGTDVVAALLPAGTAGGEVLALADASILGGQNPVTPNLAFWRNLARYARTRAMPAPPR